MTLTEVHSDPRLLADMLGVPFEAGTRAERTSWYGYAGSNYKTVEVTAEDRVGHAWKDYRADLEAVWFKAAANPHKWQTRAQFIAECLRESLGIRQRGTVASKVEYARMLRPDIYTA